MRMAVRVERRLPLPARAGTHLRHGQALVEFALVLPILLLLVLGVFEFGRAWHAYQVITDAAREGARLAVVAQGTLPRPKAEVIAAVEAALARASLSQADDISVTVPSGVEPDFWPGDPYDNVTVAIQYRFQFLVIGPLLGWTTGQSRITLSTTSVMRKEW